MRLRLASGVAIAFFGVTASAAAQGRSPRRYEAALRLGYSAGSALGVPGFTFIGLDAGYHLSPRWSVGPYAEVGFIDTVVQRHEGPETFLGHHYRLGAQVFLQLLPKGLIDPWLGLGTGYAALGVDVHSSIVVSSPPQASDYRQTARGFEWLNLQAGVNLNLAPAFALGGFARLALVDYLSQHRALGEPHEPLRGWLSAGAKATLRF
ncbi:MAG: outer membrane beta-barrel protein [Polyangiaceae bacterium]